RIDGHTDLRRNRPRHAETRRRSAGEEVQPSACVLDVIDMGLESRTRPEGDIPIHGGSLEDLGKHRLLALGLFTREVHHALICTSVARRVVLSHENRGYARGVPGIQPSAERTTTPSFG